MDDFISYNQQPTSINQFPALQESYDQDLPTEWRQGGSSGKISVSVHCLQKAGNQFLNKVLNARV